MKQCIRRRLGTRVLGEGGGEDCEEEGGGGNDERDGGEGVLNRGRRKKEMEIGKERLRIQSDEEGRFGESRGQTGDVRWGRGDKKYRNIGEGEDVGGNLRWRF